MMNKSSILIATILVFIALVGNAQSFPGKVQPNPGTIDPNSGNGGYVIDRNDQVVVGLLTLVLTDLQMCGASLQQGRLIDNVSAIGHLNNSQSALKAANLDSSYTPLVNELLERIGKVKFYLVMRDYNAVVMRLNQLIAMVRGLLTGQMGMPGYGTGLPNYGNGTFQYYPPGTGQNVPVFPREVPVDGGTQVQPTGLPYGVRPPNN